MLDWMIQVISKLTKLTGNCDPLVFFKSCQLLDNYNNSRCQAGLPLHKNALHAVGVACLMISAEILGKSNELSLENLNDDACHGSIEKSNILEAKILVIRANINKLGRETLFEEAHRLLSIELLGIHLIPDKDWIFLRALVTYLSHIALFES